MHHLARSRALLRRLRRATDVPALPHFLKMAEEQRQLGKPCMIPKELGTERAWKCSMATTWKHRHILTESGKQKGCRESGAPSRQFPDIVFLHHHNESAPYARQRTSPDPLPCALRALRASLFMPQCVVRIQLRCASGRKPRRPKRRQRKQKHNHREG
jgi:hypothetical protein